MQSDSNVRTFMAPPRPYTWREFACELLAMFCALFFVLGPRVDRVEVVIATVAALVILCAVVVIAESVWHDSKRRACRLRGHRWAFPTPIQQAWCCKRCGYVVDYGHAEGWE